MNFLVHVPAFLFDVRLESANTGNAIAAVAGIAFFLVLAALAAVAFFFIKRTVKMAIRMAIVGVILLIAIVGGISFWMFSSSDSAPTKRPTNSRNR